MPRLLLLSVFLLAAGHVTWSRNVDADLAEWVEEDRQAQGGALEESADFDDVEDALDDLFDAVEGTVRREARRVSAGRAENDDTLNERLVEVIEDAEDLDDDVEDIVDSIEQAEDEDEEEDFEDGEEEEGELKGDGDGSTEEEEEEELDDEDEEEIAKEDIDVLQADAAAIATDTARLVESLTSNPDGTAKTQTSQRLKEDVAEVEEKTEDVVEAVNLLEARIRTRILDRKTKSETPKPRDHDLEGYQGDMPIFGPHSDGYKDYIPDISGGDNDNNDDNDKAGGMRRPANVIEVQNSPAKPPPIPDLAGGSDPSDAAHSDARGGSYYAGSRSSGGYVTGSREAANTPYPVGNAPLPVDVTRSHGYDPRAPVSRNDPRRYRSSSSSSTSSSSSAGRSPYSDVIARYEARKREIEREDEYRRKQAEAARAEMNSRSSTSSSGRFNRFDFDAEFGRSNNQYYNTEGLENYLDKCPDCVGMTTESTCPLNAEVLEMKKWANELQELLSFGCKKPESCTLPGICCVNERYPFEQTVVQMTQMLKDVYNLLQDRCSKGCYGDPEKLREPPMWSPWGSWSACDVTCGQGVRERRRSCPDNESGLYCNGTAVDLAICNQRSCCEDGNWSPWTSWSRCSATCGQGMQERSRTCSDPPPNYCGQKCRGPPMERRTCQGPRDCCIDGNWNSWSRWSACSATCGGGVATRQRRCSNPAPNFCGMSCPGQSMEEKRCGNQQECCVDGQWGRWNAWTSCSVSCGRGIKSRMRRCDSPAPNFCGLRCQGLGQENSVCDAGMCCEDGNWGSWGSWEPCSTTCGAGNQLRRRRCDSPPPNSCGRSCDGLPADLRECNMGSCCVDGNWGSWQRWSECSATCGRGSRTRERNCDSPSPDWCGRKCPGPDLETELCDSRIACITCVDGNWASWQSWSACTATCGQGSRERRRTCSDPPANECGQQCFGSAMDLESCDSPMPIVDGNWGSWTSWSQCSVTCGRGQRERSRRCDRPAANACGRDCPGSSYQLDACDAGSCIDCNLVQWNQWGSWSRCSATCGTGMRKRLRECSNPYPGRCDEQLYCFGDRTEDEACATGVHCCDDVRWSFWSDWTQCSTDCGRGMQERSRTCLNAKPGCEADCPGSEEEIRDCESTACCSQVQWSSWTSWGGCSATCDRGMQERQRDCLNPYPRVCDSQDFCWGRANEERSCDSGTACCVDGNWGSWTFWSSCSVTCGYGTVERRRICDSPPKNYCGRDCPGRAVERETCQEQACITCVDGNWGTWGAWSRCSVSCGEGSKERRRLCDDPPANFCGRPCDGLEYETDRCDDNPACAPVCVDGNWGSWSTWGACSATCGRGQRRRSRYCDMPRPNECGLLCLGDGDEYETCQDRPCEECAQRQWTEWGTWGLCSATCGFGRRTRNRYCEFLTGFRSNEVDCGSRSYDNCRGDSRQEEECPNLRECPVWGEWSPCSATCRGVGVRERRQYARTPGADASQVERESCTVDSPECPPTIEWGSWGSCSATCRGYGVRERFALFRTDLGSLEVDASQVQREQCQTYGPECPMWSSWGACSVTCRGEGVRERRLVTSRDLGDGVADAERVETERCIVDFPECPALYQDAFWAEWAKWCPCDCKEGVRSRRRECVVEDFRTGVRETVGLTYCRGGNGREEESCDVVGVCPECITSCQLRADGTYPACSACDEYIRCRGGRADQPIMRCSAANTEFDAFVSKCVQAPSPSCSLQQCVKDCRDQADGQYHSCSNCSSYVTCARGRALETSCPGNGWEFNAHFGTCTDTRSPTCVRSLQLDIPRFYNDAPADEYYDEKNGLDPEQRREMYEKTRVKTKEELLKEAAVEAEAERERLVAGAAAMRDNMVEGGVGDKEEEEEEEVDDERNEDAPEDDGLLAKMNNFLKRVRGTDTPIDNCVSSCDGVRRGRHPSCKGCQFYWLCFRQRVQHRKCSGDLVWDNKLKDCVEYSTTCPSES